MTNNITGGPLEIAWAAGLFEGEGCMYLHERRPGLPGRRPRLALSMTDWDVVARFAAVVGYGKVKGPHVPRHEHWKPQWAWGVSRPEDVRLVLNAFLPYFGERRAEKARECLAAMEAHPARQYARRVGGDDTCGRGHDRIGGNAYRNDLGHWICRVCRRTNERKRSEQSN